MSSRKSSTDETTGGGSLGESFRIQLRVVGALMMREVLTRYGRHNVGFLWLFFEPMLFTLGITALWTVTRASHGSGVSVASFALTGYSSVILWRSALTRSTKALEPNLALLYHRNVRPLDVYLARILLEIVSATASFVILALVFIGIELIEPPSDLVRMMGGWALLACFSVTLGLVFGPLSERTELVERFMHTAMYLLFPLSGAAFLADWLPERARAFVLMIPMFNCVEMIRHGYYGDSLRTYEDPLYVVEVTLVFALVGLRLVQQVGARVEPE
jgi:capsular polysaccharide transport system permease protein